MVGFAEDSDLLLVLSHDGAGVFDATCGARIARDADVNSFELLDSIKCIARGIGPLADQRIAIAGLFGGGLTTVTKDGFFVDSRAPQWPSHIIVLRQERVEHIVGTDGACELRAFGFSHTGRSLIIATSCDITFFARD